MWNLKGERVQGLYLGEFPVAGVCTESRITEGGHVMHFVMVDADTVVPLDNWKEHPAPREVIMSEKQVSLV